MSDCSHPQFSSTIRFVAEPSFYSFVGTQMAVDQNQDSFEGLSKPWNSGDRDNFPHQLHPSIPATDPEVDQPSPTRLSEPEDLVSTQSIQIQTLKTQLQQTSAFETALQRITENICASVDPQQILQTVVDELAIALHTERCSISLYEPECTISTQACKPGAAWLSYGSSPISPPGSEANKEEPVFVAQVNTHTTSTKAPSSLIYPIQIDEEIFGDLWIVGHPSIPFTEREAQFVQQVTNWCAIALRQVQFHQIAQERRAELEKLDHLKKDFFCTVSHELRTPLTTIKTGIQLLNVVLNASPPPQETQVLVNKYLHVLGEACEQEINLINDLVALQQAEDNEELIVPAEIELQTWLLEVLSCFEKKACEQKQRLTLEIPKTLPRFVSHPFTLERILKELVTNAQKYTPAGEQITISAIANQSTLQLKITNSGVEISPAALSRIFEKFYRIPNNDPWKSGGTGLGLALVQKLVVYLQGSIQVESGNHQTCFTIELPLNGFD